MAVSLLPDVTFSCVLQSCTHMASPRRRLSLRVAALTLSAIGAVLMDGGGSTAAAVVTRVDQAAHHGRDRDRASHHDGDRDRDRDRAHERTHATRDHGSHESSSSHHQDHDRVPGGTRHLTGSDSRDAGCGDSDSSDTNCVGDRGVDRGTAHRASGVAAGRAPAAAPVPTNDSGDAARSAGRPAPPDAGTTRTTTTSTTSTVSAGVAASGLPASGAHSPVAVPVTGAEERIGIGLLLWLAGLIGLVLARRR